MKISADSPIGIFDSGVGGLSVAEAIKQLLPYEKLIYVADSLHTPYGNKSDEFILERSKKIAHFLTSQNVKAIVVACNTATAASIHFLRNHYAIPIIGLEPALKPAVEKSQLKRVGVLATKSTLESEKYQRLKRNIGEQCQVIEVASSLLVELVESAQLMNQTTIAQIQNELKPFVKANIDSLVLGCTHYPFLTSTIRHIMGENITLFESALPVSLELEKKIANKKSTQMIKNQIAYYSSEPDASQAIFERLLNKKILVNKFG